jgi:hypothetical protein
VFLVFLIFLLLPSNIGLKPLWPNQADGRIMAARRYINYNFKNGNIF